MIAGDCAHLLGDCHIVPVTQRDSGGFVGTEGERHTLKRTVQFQRFRAEPAGAAARQEFAVMFDLNGRTAVLPDFQVVSQYIIGITGIGKKIIVAARIVGIDRLGAADKREGIELTLKRIGRRAAFKQQAQQRGRGEGKPQRFREIRTEQIGGKRDVFLAPEDDDRSGGGGQRLCFQFGAMTVLSGDFQIADHDRNRFSADRFPSPQFRHGIAVERIAKRDKAVVGLDGDDAALLELVTCGFQRRIGVGDVTRWIHQQRAWSAERTGLIGIAVRFGVCLSGTELARGKRHECGVFPVERRHGGDGVARTAVFARDKRIMVEPGFGIQHFADTVGTRSLIGFDSCDMKGGTKQFERNFSFRGERRCGNFLNQPDGGQVKRARKPDRKRTDEFADSAVFSDQPQGCAVGSFRNPAAETRFRCHFPDEWTEARSIQASFQFKRDRTAHNDIPRCCVSETPGYELAAASPGVSRRFSFKHEQFSACLSIFPVKKTEKCKISQVYD